MSDEAAPDFELPNAGPGPDPCSLADLTAGSDFVVLYFQRAGDSVACRKQVTHVKKRYDSFRARDAVPAAILPEPRQTAAEWQARYDLPFPLLADESNDVAADYGQPVRLGFLSDVSDVFGRVPYVVVVDARRPEPRIVWTHKSKTAQNRPESRAILGAVDDYRE